MARFIDITEVTEHLGAVSMVTSNVEKFIADFSCLLGQGVFLTSIEASVDPVINEDAVANGFDLTHDQKKASWYMESPDDPSSYPLAITLTTSDGQFLNYTLQYNVSAP